MKKYIKTKKGFVEFNFENDGRCLYEKRGKKFVPTNEYIDYFNYFKEGHYLVSVVPHGLSITSRVFANRIELQSIIRERADEINKIVLDKLKMRPAKKLITKKQRDAWVAFEKAMGNDSYICEFGAIQEIIDAIEECLCGGTKEKED